MKACNIGREAYTFENALTLIGCLPSDDASITAQVKMILLYHRSTSALDTSVTTKNGVVTLDGKAKSADERDLAAKLVNDVNGVKSVKNLIKIE